MDEEQRARRWFLAVWAIVTMVKVAIAARLPLFVTSQETRSVSPTFIVLPLICKLP